MVPSTPVSTRPVRFFPSRVGCWRAAARSGFTPRGAGNPGRHQLRLLSATRAGPGHAPVRTSCGRPRARSAARPPGDGILVPASFRCRLAANPCARALSPGFTPGQNFLRWRLLEPAARKLYVNWDEATEIAVSGLREVAGSDMGDPRLRALIDELTAASQRFRELWARADVGYRKKHHPHASPASWRSSSPPEPARCAALRWAAPADLLRRAWQRVSQGARGASRTCGHCHR